MQKLKKGMSEQGTYIRGNRMPQVITDESIVTLLIQVIDFILPVKTLSNLLEDKGWGKHGLPIRRLWPSRHYWARNYSVVLPLFEISNISKWTLDDDLLERKGLSLPNAIRDAYGFRPSILCDLKSFTNKHINMPREMEKTSKEKLFTSSRIWPFKATTKRLVHLLWVHRIKKGTHLVPLVLRVILGKYSKNKCCKT